MPTFSPSCLLVEGAVDGVECVESELEVDSRVKVGPGKILRSSRVWLTMR